METTSENILNVTLLEPRKKHPTIFARYDELNPGESLTIHNDHDPKPLYYQLLGERGDSFAWEYLEQGPEWWKVRISKKGADSKSETLGEIVRKDLRKAQIFKKYGLDFCCGGKKTVKQACAEKGLDVTIIEHELQKADQTITSTNLPYHEWSLSFLADFIVATHHSYIRKNLPDIMTYANKVMRVHSDTYPELVQVNQLVQAFNEELVPHMMKEEKILFPYIKELAHAKEKNEPSQGSHFGTVQNPIRMMEMEHDAVGEIAAELRQVTRDFTLPIDACASYTLLYRLLQEFEDDLHLHIHLENNILFPKAIELEKELTTT